MDEFLALGHQRSMLKGVGITNQRETTVVWDRETGEPLCNAGAHPFFHRSRPRSGLCAGVLLQSAIASREVRGGGGRLTDSGCGAAKPSILAEHPAKHT